MRLLPKQEKFFDYLTGQAELITRAASLLAEAARGDEAAKTNAFERISKMEIDGDAKALEVYRRLSQTFLTPIDAEDIHSLASCLDDILDGLEETSYRVAHYQVQPVPPAVIRMAELIKNACAEVLLGVTALANHKRVVLEHCIEINRCEDEVDKELRDALRLLFETEKDAINLIKIKEVLEILEDTADRCEDVSAALQNIVVKNS